MSKENVVPAEDNDKAEMVVKTALGQAHPAQCWGWHDEKAKECGQCLVAEKCEDFTRRLSGKGTPVVQPPSGIVKPKSLAVAAEKQAAEPKAEPKAEVKSEPKAEPKNETKPEPKSEPKVEAKPVVKDEPPVRPKTQTEPQPEEDAIAAAILPRIPDGTFSKKENDKGFVYNFLNGDKKVVLQIGVSKESGRMKLLSTKGNKVMDVKFSDADMTAALDALL